jgi:hypothetical protein
MSTFLVEDELRRKNNCSRIRRAVIDNLVALDDTDVTRSSEAVHAADSSSNGEGWADSLVDRKDTLSNRNAKQSESAERNGAIELSAMFAENPLRASALPTSSSAKAEPGVTFLAESSAEVGKIDVEPTESVSAAIEATSETTAGAGAVNAVSMKTVVAASASESK